MKLCSACLLGFNCRYDGGARTNEKVLALAKKEVLIPVCPEQLGGLPTPREQAEIAGGTGFDTFSGKAKIITKSGKDVTENYIKGANEVLKIAKSLGIREAIMKQRSPSCGCG